MTKAQIYCGLWCCARALAYVRNLCAPCAMVCAMVSAQLYTEENIRMCVRAHVHAVGDGGGPTNPFAILSCCALVLFRLAKVNYASARFCVPASCSFTEADEAFGRHSCVLVSHTNAYFLGKPKASDQVMSFWVIR